MGIFFTEVALLLTFFRAVFVFGQKARKLLVIAELLLFERHDVVDIDFELFEMVHQDFLLFDKEANLVVVFFDLDFAILLKGVLDGNFYLIVLHNVRSGCSFKTFEAL